MHFSSFYLVVALAGSYEIAIFNGITTEMLFTRSSQTLTVNHPSDEMLGGIEAADLNEDGLTDLIILSRVTSYSRGSAPIWIFFNLGVNLSFENSTDISLPNYNSITFGDLNNDGQQNDIGLSSNNGLVYTFISVNSTIQALSWPQTFLMYGTTTSLIKGKFNDDERLDMGLISSETDTLQILLAYEQGEFILHSYSTITEPTSLARVNFNNDQIDDLAVLSCSGTVTVFLGTLMGLFDRNYLSFNVNGNLSDVCASSLKVADLNGDGRDDLVFLKMATQSIHVLLAASCNEA